MVCSEVVKRLQKVINMINRDIKSIVKNLIIRPKMISIIVNKKRKKYDYRNNKRVFISLYDKNNNKYCQNSFIVDNKQIILDKIVELSNG